MKISLRSLTVFALACGFALPLSAADPAKKADKAAKKAAAAPAGMYKLPDAVTLSDEQKPKVEAIDAKYKPKFAALQKENGELLTAEQKKARHDAMAAAKAEGKKQKEAMAAAEAAMDLTDEQKSKLTDVKERTMKLRTEMQTEVVAVLTPEQKEQLPKPKKAEGKPKKNKKPE